MEKIEKYNEMNIKVTPNIRLRNGESLALFLIENGILGNNPKETDELDNLIERLIIFKEYGDYLKKEKNSLCILKIDHTKMELSVTIPSKLNEFETGEVPNIKYREVNFVSVGDECGNYGEKPRSKNPLAKGKIVDKMLAERAVADYFNDVKENHDKTPISKLLVIVPSDFTKEDLDVLRGAVQKTGAKDIRFIYRPLAEAIRIGCDIYNTKAKMVVHFGEAVSEISVIVLGGIVASKTVPVSVNTFAEDMHDYIRSKFNVQIDIETARKDLLTNYWSFPTGKSRNKKKKKLVDGAPESIDLSYDDVSDALGNSLKKIEEAVTEVLDILPPELLGDLAIEKVDSLLIRKENSSFTKTDSDSWVFFGLNEGIYFEKDEQITVTANGPFAPALKERIGETLAHYFQRSLPKDVVEEYKKNLSKIIVDEDTDTSFNWGDWYFLVLFDRFDDILIK